jgi:multidrug efflux pump subunit AcrB
VTVRALSRLGTNRFNLYRAVQLLGNAASLGLVFLILSGLYESWALPFSVLLSVPIA